MTTTPPPPPTDTAPGDTGPGDTGHGDTGPRVTGAQARDLARLRRTVGPDRYVAGVAGGLARHLDIDPVLVRVALVVLTFFGGAGILLYAAAWLLVPEDGSDAAPLSLDERSRTVALVAAGVLAGLALLGDAWGPGFFPWPLALLALLVYLLLRRRDRRHRPTQRAAEPTPEPTAYGPTTWAPPPPPAPDPRRRGPRLFGFTMALAAFAVGVLGLVDVAGVDVPGAGYPALVLAVVAAALVLGAFWGRAGGLIAVGLLASVVLLATSATGHFEGDRVRFAPETAAEVEDAYSVGAGELVLDLRGVDDLDELDGRTVDVDAEVGRIAVLLPVGLETDLRAEVSGPGEVDLFGTDAGGFGVTRFSSPDPGTGDPVLTLDLDLEVGQIEVD